MTPQRRDELERMYKWLDEKIQDYEYDFLWEGVATLMTTSQHESSRQEYAGWIAERDMIERLLKDKNLATLPYVNNNDYDFSKLPPFGG